MAALHVHVLVTCVLLLDVAPLWSHAAGGYVSSPEEYKDFESEDRVQKALHEKGVSFLGVYHHDTRDDPELSMRFHPRDGSFLRYDSRSRLFDQLPTLIWINGTSLDASSGQFREWEFNRAKKIIDAMSTRRLDGEVVVSPSMLALVPKSPMIDRYALHNAATTNKFLKGRALIPFFIDSHRAMSEIAPFLARLLKFERSFVVSGLKSETLFIRYVISPLQLGEKVAFVWWGDRLPVEQRPANFDTFKNAFWAQAKYMGPHWTFAECPPFTDAAGRVVDQAGYEALMDRYNPLRHDVVAYVHDRNMSNVFHFRPVGVSLSRLGQLRPWSVAAAPAFAFDPLAVNLAERQFASFVAAVSLSRFADWYDAGGSSSSDASSGELGGRYLHSVIRDYPIKDIHRCSPAFAKVELGDRIQVVGNGLVVSAPFRNREIEHFRWSTPGRTLTVGAGDSGLPPMLEMQFLGLCAGRRIRFHMRERMPDNLESPEMVAHVMEHVPEGEAYLFDVVRFERKASNVSSSHADDEADTAAAPKMTRAMVFQRHRGQFRAMHETLREVSLDADEKQMREHRRWKALLDL